MRQFLIPVAFGLFALASAYLIRVGFSRGTSPRGRYWFFAVGGLLLVVALTLSALAFRFVVPGPRSDLALILLFGVYLSAWIVTIVVSQWRSYRQYLAREAMLEIEDLMLSLPPSIF